MGSLGYDKWAALDSDDEDGPKPKAKTVRKQAVHITRACELAEAAEESRQAAAELAQLQERAERLQHEMEKARERMLAAGGSDDSDCDDPEASKRLAIVADERQRPLLAADGPSAVKEEAEGLPEPAKLTRRSMDREREVDEERTFEARPAPDGGRGQSIAAELRTAASASRDTVCKLEPCETEGPGGTASTARLATTCSSASALEQRKQKKSSLRRLKQLDQEVATALHRECGLNLSKADVFRLVMENPGSHLKQHTSVLVVAAGETFLCPEPAPGKSGAVTSSLCPAGSAGAAAAVVESPTIDNPTAVGSLVSETSIVAESCGLVEGTATQDSSRSPPRAEDAATSLGRVAAAEDRTPLQLQPSASADANLACSEAVHSVDNEGSDEAPQEVDSKQFVDRHNSVDGEAVPVDTRESVESSREGKAAVRHHMTEDEGIVKVELRFFRATPKLSALARKIGKVPILHIALSSGRDLDQCLEFIGIHQRRYCAEEPPCDAIAQNLVESLLRVALEFIFHPTRSKYSKERLLLRECSRSAEALKSRDDFLPRMVDNLVSMNKDIRHVEIEFCMGSQQSIGTGGKKDRSFLILDEDALKVAPVKGPGPKAPPASKSFKGLGKGFLNTEDAKRKGLSPESEPCVPAAATVDAVQHSILESIPVSERTRINPLPEADGPPRIRTTAQERQTLLLPAADLHPGVPEDVRRMAEPLARLISSNEGAEVSATGAAAAGGPEDGEGPELSEQQQLRSLSELADQLFGDLAQQSEDVHPMEESGEEGRTASTELPSPTATSSRDGGGASERSERGEAISSAEVADVPAAGLRLLQQRRRERTQAGLAAPPVRDESEDLVNLWMKQRW